MACTASANHVQIIVIAPERRHQLHWVALWLIQTAFSCRMTYGNLEQKNLTWFWPSLIYQKYYHITKTMDRALHHTVQLNNIFPKKHLCIFNVWARLCGQIIKHFINVNLRFGKKHQILGVTAPLNVYYEK